MKFYAVREGRETGLFYSWDECKAQVNGYKGAVFKSFDSEEEARKYLDEYTKHEDYFDVSFEGYELHDGIKIPKLSRPLDEGKVLVYVDGSNNQDLLIVGWGFIVYYKDEIYTGFGSKDDDFLIPLRNVGGEISAVLEATNVIDNIPGVKEIEIRYDYNGLRDWAYGSWKTNNDGTALYAGIMKTFIEAYDGKVVFHHTKGHSGELGNEAADQLAKKGALINDGEVIIVEEEKEDITGDFPIFFLDE